MKMEIANRKIAFRRIRIIRGAAEERESKNKSIFFAWIDYRNWKPVELKR